MEDNVKKHFLSTKGIYIEPLWLRAHRDRIAELKEKLDRELELIETLSKKGLLDTYIEMENKYSKKGRDMENKCKSLL